MRLSIEFDFVSLKKRYLWNADEPLAQARKMKNLISLYSIIITNGQWRLFVFWDIDLVHETSHHLSKARMRLRTRIVKCTHEDYIICPYHVCRIRNSEHRGCLLTIQVRNILKNNYSVSCRGYKILYCLLMIKGYKYRSSCLWFWGVFHSKN